jgi:hypothetical protein
MHKLQLTVLFCGPSIASGLITSLLAAVMLAAANFSFLLRSGLLYDAFFGKGTPYDLIESSRDYIAVTNQVILGNPAFNKFMFFAFWMMVGLMVYALLSTLGQTIAETEEKLKSLRYVHARKAQIEQDLILRLALRAIGIIIAVVFGWLFIRLIFPFCVIASQIGLSNLSRLSGWLYLVLGYGVLLLSLHALVIILRLIVLKPRLYGDWDNLI